MVKSNPSSRLLVVDNISPFTKNIMASLDLVKVQYEYKKFYELPESNRIIDEFCGKVILSGRQVNSKESNAINCSLLRSCFKNNIPILGICFGCEIIALAFGGTIVRLKQPARQMTNVQILRRNPLVSDSRALRVFESHVYCIARLPDDFVRLGSSISCQNEIISHKSKPIFGVQFHPERSGDDGLDLIRRFVEL